MYYVALFLINLSKTNIIWVIKKKRSVDKMRKYIFLVTKLPFKFNQITYLYPHTDMYIYSSQQEEILSLKLS